MLKIKKQITDCTKCPLHKHAKNKVIGSGNWNADILLVGEAPGRNEDEQGEPFVGAAGRMLDLLLTYADIKRENIFITNILHCRPPSNRTPLSSEVHQCIHFLYKIIDIVKPKVIVPMGNTAAKWIIGTHDKIGDIHGKTFKAIGYTPIIPIYHPAAIIYNGKLLDTAKEDMKRIVDQVIRLGAKCPDCGAVVDGVKTLWCDCYSAE